MYHEKVTENVSPLSLDCVSIRGRIAAGTPGFACHINEKTPINL